METTNQQNIDVILNSLKNAQTTCENLYAAWSSSELFFENFPSADSEKLSMNSDLLEETISILEEINEYSYSQFSKLETLIQDLASSTGYEYDLLEGLIREKTKFS